VKYLAVLFVSIFFAGIAAVGVSVADPPAAEAAGGGYVPKCGGGKIFLKAEERQTFTLHNNARRERNLRAFCVHPDLQRAARAHTRDMIQRNYFSHFTKGTKIGPCERFRRQGYRYRYCAENIGEASDPARMFKAWMNSSGHREHILDRKYREIGIGVDNRASGNLVFTVDFGTRF
jgi:uncharacterized protein YkwD